MSSFYSPLFGTNYSTIVSKNALERAYFRLAKRTPVQAELAYELVGVAAGATALVARKRVTHDRDELGGVRPIETRNLVNRVTTSADQTNIRNMLTEDSRIATPANGAGTNWRA